MKFDASMQAKGSQGSALVVFSAFRIAV